MSEKYDCIEHEWQDWCRDCGETFTNIGTHGIVDCPHCEKDDEE